MNPEHLAIVKAGPDSISAWHQAHSNDWLDLSGADLSEAILSQASLARANLQGAKLIGAKLDRADLTGAVLSGADLSGADLHGAKLSGAVARAGFKISLLEVTVEQLGGADLRGADLRNSDLSAGDFRNADLRGARLDGAKLTAANFTGARLCGATLCEADLEDAKLYQMSAWDERYYVPMDWLWPTHIWFVLDRTQIRNTRFDPHSFDPYSILRQAYTGPKLTFIFFFSIVALLPLIVQAMFWSNVSRIEAQLVPIAVATVEKAADILKKEEQDESMRNWVTRANDVIRSIKDSPLMHGEWRGQLDKLQALLQVIQEGRDVLDQRRRQFVRDAAVLERLDPAASWLDQAHALIGVVAPKGQVLLRERRVWQLVIGVERGYVLATLALVLLLYNVGRAILTYQMSSLRDNEERTGESPAWDDYRWMWQVHKIARLVLIISIVSGLWRIGEMLVSVVLVPA